jgi:hypothetical protein
MEMFWSQRLRQHVSQFFIRPDILQLDVSVLDTPSSIVELDVDVKHSKNIG